ncbi:MAG TPA: hypothetical protein VKE96_12345 [Vicinamibacterales bacterium]|nr:hypothetical protein [Vicinamibacterales bacterium]
MAEQPDLTSEADLSIEDFVARGNARDRGESEPAADATPPRAPGAATTTPATPPPAPAKPRYDPEARKKSIKAEIDELTTTKHTTRREIEAAQAELVRLKVEHARLAEQRPAPPAEPAARPAPPAVRPTGPIPDDDPEPLLEHFATESDPYGSWSRAVSRWETRQEHRRIESGRRAHAMYQQRTTKLTDKLQAYEQSHPGFQRGLHPSVIDIKFTTPKELGTMLGDLIVDSDHTAALLDHFSRNLGDFQRIAALHPVLVAREIGKIEARFDAASSGPASRPQPISHAKPLNKPVGGSPHVADDDDDESELPIEEFVRRGNARDATRSHR